MKRTNRWLLALLLGGALSWAQAAPAAGRTVLYISPDDYAHPVKLWHFYYDYWFSQGEMLEPIALQALQARHIETALCEGNRAGDVLLWLKPRMFYNPHMTRFYGALTAQVYSGSGAHLATYRAQADRVGFLDVVPATRLDALYRSMMQDIAEQLGRDAAVQKLLADGLPASETAMPCGMVTITPVLQQPRKGWY